MRGTSQRIIVVALVVIVLAGAAVVGARTVYGARAATTAAKVAGEVITLDEVKEAAKPELTKLEEQRFAILDDKLERLISDRLIDREAKRRGISVDQLVRDEVIAKAPQVTGEEVAVFMAQNRERLPKGDEAQVKIQVWNYLRGLRANQQRQVFDQELRAQTQVTTYLEAPAAARVAVNAEGGFVRGATDAPVTIVEFSDFQCPYCKLVTSTLQQVLERYRGKVKLVFRDNPIAALHPDSPLAHQAARCAGEQGKFWEYHDVLFDRAPRHALADLRQYAADLGLDTTAFAQCVDSHKYDVAVNRDVQEAQRLGITGTPTFFIDGLELAGAQPVTAFQRIIDRELTRTASR
jgi:protein-disulfide isomerase